MKVDFFGAFFLATAVFCFSAWFFNWRRSVRLNRMAEEARRKRDAATKELVFFL